MARFYLELLTLHDIKATCCLERNEFSFPLLHHRPDCGVPGVGGEGAGVAPGPDQPGLLLGHAAAAAAAGRALSPAPHHSRKHFILAAIGRM